MITVAAGPDGQLRVAYAQSGRSSVLPMTGSIKTTEFGEAVSNHAEVTQKAFDNVCASCRIRNTLWDQLQLFQRVFRESGDVWGPDHRLTAFGEDRLATSLNQFFCRSDGEAWVRFDGRLHSANLFGEMLSIEHFCLFLERGQARAARRKGASQSVGIDPPMLSPVVRDRERRRDRSTRVRAFPLCGLIPVFRTHGASLPLTCLRWCSAESVFPAQCSQTQIHRKCSLKIEHVAKRHSKKCFKDAPVCRLE